MDDNVFDAVQGLGIEEIKRVVRRRQVAVHTVGHKTLGVIDVAGSFPGEEIAISNKIMRMKSEIFEKYTIIKANKPQIVKQVHGETPNISSAL